MTTRSARVESIDAAQKAVTTPDGIHYRGCILVIASGAEPNFFNTPRRKSTPTRCIALMRQPGSPERSSARGNKRSATRNTSTKQVKRSVAVLGACRLGVETAGAIAENITHVVANYLSEQFAADSWEVNHAATDRPASPILPQ